MSQDTSVKSPLTSAFRPELKTGVFRITLKSDSKISDELNPSPKLNPDDSVLAPPRENIWNFNKQVGGSFGIIRCSGPYRRPH